MRHRALVTGGSSGLGAATATRLQGDGIEVITVDRAPGSDLVLDVIDDDAVRSAAAEIGPIDILVNSAGIVGAGKALVDTTPDEWRAVFDVNVFGTVNMMRAFVPGMRDAGWGRVVNFASMAGKDGNPNLSGYSASKAAGNRPPEAPGKELGAGGGRRKAVAPPGVA